MRGLTGVLLILLIPAVTAAQLPAKRLDLSNWMLTLPIDADHSGRADEVKQPDLASFTDPDWFFVDEESGAVVFRAHCGGATTKGSSYPRCELRERANRGKVGAAWSTDDELAHHMTMRVAVTHTPAVKKHVVCAQIHDANDDVMMIRLEGTKLFVERNSLGDVILDREYQLGTPFELKIQAGGGRIQVWYQQQLKMTWDVSRRGCYFKAGCYTQSNPGKGDSADSFGEVMIYELAVSQRK